MVLNQRAVYALCLGFGIVSGAHFLLPQAQITGLPRFRQLTLPQLEAESFHRPSTPIAVSSTGHIAFPAPFTDAALPRLRIIDTMGKVLVRTARTGKGPGELTNPVFWFASGDSAVLVFDMATLRLSHFAHDGRYVGARQYNTLVVPKAVTGDSIDVQLGNQPDLKLVRQSWSSAPEGRDLVGASDPTFEAAFPVTEVNGNRRRSLPSHAANQTRFAVGNGRTGEILIYDRAGRFIGSTGKAESSLPSALEVREFEANARSFRFPDGRSRSEESIAAEVDRFRKTPRLFFSHTKGLAFDQRGRLWAIGKVGDQVVARIYLDTKYLGSVTIPCHGFADSFDLNGSWLALLCVDKASADETTVLQLYHLEEGPASKAQRKP